MGVIINYSRKNNTKEENIGAMDEKEIGGNNNNSNSGNFTNSVTLVCTMIMTFVAIIGGIIYIVSSITSLNVRFDNMNANFVTKMDEFSTDIGNINSNVETITSELASMESEIEDLKRDRGTYQPYKLVYPTENLNDALRGTYVSYETAYSASNVLWDDSDEVIGIDVNTGEDVKVADGENETLVVFYTDGEEEVFFKGQYDENGRWNDNCIINRYRDGQLVLIMDAVYESGKLISYSQLFSYVNTAGIHVWAIAERTVDGEEHSGNTSTYYYDVNNNYEKYFDSNKVTDKDIINVSEFKSNMNLLQEGYYSGYTSNGRFNDDTGTAYIVKYDRFGYVRMLYCGKIRDGIPNDESLTAWYIVRQDNTDYMHYIGDFRDGHPANGDGSKFNNPFSYNEIQGVLEGKEFDCPLEWYQEEYF